MRFNFLQHSKEAFIQIQSQSTIDRAKHLNKLSKLLIVVSKSVRDFLVSISIKPSHIHNLSRLQYPKV